MRLALLADTFPPLRSSGAVQLRDLAAEFARQGHELTVITPGTDPGRPWRIDHQNGHEILRLLAPTTKDVGLLRRTLAEIAMPFSMWWNMRRSPLYCQKWDGVIWYSPTIFLGPLAKILKARSHCPTYLIIRDIFPEWAVDMGLMRRGVAYWFFKTVERFQYRVADTVGVQSNSNLAYFADWSATPGHHVEILQNWLDPAPDVGCRIDLATGPLAGRKLFVYAGNMGVAQGIDTLLDLAGRMQSRRDVGFVFVGRGSEAARLRERALGQGMNNVQFFDEIEPAEVAGLYAQCHVGLVALDIRHKTHNVPGKFVSYMQAGLPVLAIINPGNGLEALINEERVGRATTDRSPDTLESLAHRLLDEIDNDAGDLSSRCWLLGDRLFSPQTAVSQIVAALSR